MNGIKNFYQNYKNLKEKGKYFLIKIKNLGNYFRQKFNLNVNFFIFSNKMEPKEQVQYSIPIFLLTYKK